MDEIEQMTKRDIEIFLEFHSDRLYHVQLTLEELRKDTIRMLEIMEDMDAEIDKKTKTSKSI